MRRPWSVVVEGSFTEGDTTLCFRWTCWVTPAYLLGWWWLDADGVTKWALTRSGARRKLRAAYA